MSYFTSVQQIIDKVLINAGELPGATSPYQSEILGHINKMSLALFRGLTEFNVALAEDWVWARSLTPSPLLLLPPYSTGTVNLTSGSASATFSSPPASSAAGAYLQVVGRAEVYRITSHTGGAGAFTLDSNYVGTSDTAASFKVLYLDYALPNTVLRLTKSIHVPVSNHNGYEIDFVTPDRFAKDYPISRTAQGVPTKFTVVGETAGASNGVLTLRFNGYVSETIRTDYNYIVVPTAYTASSVPVEPLGERPVLEYAATYWFLHNRDDNRAQNYYRDTQAKLQSMVMQYRKAAAKKGPGWGRMYTRGNSGDHLTETSSGIILWP